jgi:hypothetical protein
MDSMRLIWGVVYGGGGLALILWAVPLSIRYNAWTTRLRERHPNFNPPPIPEWLARNTKIMTALFRVAGAFFVLVGALSLLSLFVEKSH